MSEPGADRRWEKDFPVEWEADNYVTRREFAKFLALASLGLLAGNVLLLLKQLWRAAHPLVVPRTLVGRLADIPVGESKLFRYPTRRDPCLLIRTGDKDVHAYSQKCTHLSCAVLYEGSVGKIRCPCHHGWFDAKTGGVLAGPPQRRLPRIALERRGGEIWAVGVER